MVIYTAGSRTSKRWKPEELSWTELVDRLRTPKRTGETMAEYRSMSKDEKAQRKDIGGFVGGELVGRERKKGAVKNRCLITLDADTASFDDVSDFALTRNYAFCVYSTHSHTKTAPRLRWILPLDRPVSSDEYVPIARRVAQWVGINTMDRSTFEDWRLMFWPSCAEDADYYFEEGRGDRVCADDVLRSYCTDDELNRGVEGWRDISRWPIADSENGIIRNEMKRQSDPTGKRGIIGSFCRLYDVPTAIAEFGLPYEPCDVGGRYTYTEGSTYAGAVVYGDGKWLYSNHGTDPCGGLLCNSFDLVRIHRFGARDDGVRADCSAEKLPSYVAMCEWASSLDEVKRQFIEERTASANTDFSDMVGAADGGSGDVDGDGCEGDGICEVEEDQWELTLNNKTGLPEITLSNATEILKHDPALKGALAYNDFTDRPVVRRDLPWRKYRPPEYGKAGDDAWMESDDSNLRLYMEKKWHYSHNGNLRDAWMICCTDNSFHPIREYLNNLPPWDGVERADTILVRYMAAEDNRINRAFTRKWLVAAVKRVFHPGCKFDTMLMLVGRQGAGKSQLGDVLSQGWFNNSMTTFEGKEANESAHSAWIIEIAEMAAAKKSETETVKAFVSRKKDTWRPAYAHHVKDFPRQCVFYGTTNDFEFLNDTTGGRRFWPVVVERFNQGRLDGLEEEADQIWAEALVRFREGETIWLDDDSLEQEARALQEMFTKQDENVGMIAEYLDTPIPTNWYEMDVDDRVDYLKGRSMVDKDCKKMRRDIVSVVEIRSELYGEDRKAMVDGRNYNTAKIAKIMNQNIVGWKKLKTKVRSKGYGPQWCYVRIGSEKEAEYCGHNSGLDDDILS